MQRSHKEISEMYMCDGLKLPNCKNDRGTTLTETMKIVSCFFIFVLYATHTLITTVQSSHTVYNESCYGCSNPDLGCHNMTGDGYVFACKGTFSGGMAGTEASSICSDTYQLCNNLDAYKRGLTESQCSSLPSNEIYFTNDTAWSHAKCESYWGEQGDVADDVFACGSSYCVTSLMTTSRYCYSSNSFCQSGLDIYNSSGSLAITTGSSGTQEYNNVAVYDSDYGGVLCCVKGIHTVYFV